MVKENPIPSAVVGGGLVLAIVLGGRPRYDSKGNLIESDSIKRDQIRAQVELTKAQLSAQTAGAKIKSDYMSHQGDNSIKMKALTNDFTLKSTAMDYTKIYKTIQQQKDNEFRLIAQQNATDLNRMNLNFNHDIGMTNSWLNFGSNLFGGMTQLFSGFF